ncbi:MAG: hypothetical protein ACRDCT_13810 [Shewanella sp.]
MFEGFFFECVNFQFLWLVEGAEQGCLEKIFCVEVWAHSKKNKNEILDCMEKI